MLIYLALALILEDGDGPMTDVIVELLECAGDDAGRLLPRPALVQYRFESAAQEKRLPQLRVALMSQEVPVMSTIRRQQVLERHANHRIGLRDIGKRRTAALLQDRQAL